MIKEIITPRIKLKIVEKTDSEKIHLLRTNPIVAKFITRNLNVSVTDIEHFIEDKLSDLDKVLFYKIETIPDLELVGAIVLKNIDRERKYAEVGYELFPRFEGQGLMTMALEKIVETAFEHLDLKELEAFTHRDNLKSRKLLEKLRFIKTDKVDGKYAYNVIYNLKKASM
jgi:[ribosomal protein S5]-alanine N-acetyltransferase